jgi:hypothetical protein
MPAHGRSSAATGLAVALVVFVILFVLSLIVAIFMFTQKDAADQQATVERAKRLKLLSAADEQNQPLMSVVNVESRESVVKRLWDESQYLKTISTGDAQASREAIRAEMDASKLIGEGQTLLQLAKQMAAELSKVRGEKDQALAQRDAEKKRADQAEAEKAIRDRAFRDAEEALKSKLDGAVGGHTAFKKQAEESMQKLEGDLKAVQDQLAGAIKERGDAEKALKDQIAGLQKKIGDMLAQLGTKGGVDSKPWKNADGKIISVISEENVVYINRGRRDHLTLGMTFQVFDPLKGVTLDPDDEKSIPGKAVAEVISIGENSSVCRIIPQSSRKVRAQAVIEGDLLANLVYDPNVKYKFYVWGEFDINYTGTTSGADKKRVQAMVSEWGGRLADKMDYDVDFLVLGIPPELPQPPPAGTVDPALLTAYAEKRKIWDEYQRLVAEAAELRVPKLNQNRFLDMVGYYQR